MKKLLPVLLLLLLLGVGGYFYLTSRGMVPKAPLGSAGNTTQNGGIFTSIKDALSKSMSLKCVYKDEEGVETTTYIKGGALRVMMINAKEGEQPNNIVMKDKMMYMWNDTTKTGFSYKIEEPKDVTPIPTVEDKTVNKETGDDQKESVLAQIEKYKDTCKVETVVDSMFAVPTDVKFQDMSALQEQMMKTVPQAPQGGSQEDMQKYIQEMMKQQGENQ